MSSEDAGRTEADKLARQLLEALEVGDHAQAIELTRRIERQLAGLPDAEAEVPGPAGRNESKGFEAPPSVVSVRPAPRPRPRGSARQAVVATLSEIGVPSRARLVVDYARARFGQRVETRAVSALRRDERRAWGRSSARPTYVVPALEGRFYQPIRGLLALSDWALERRLVGPWSERADHLAATAQLARQLAWLNERDEETAERLAPVVAGMARSIPGAVDEAEVDTARVESAAEAERSALAERDEPWRQEAADRARAQLSEEQQLWGTQVGVVAQRER
jgi:hypothetical protein